MHFGKGKDGIGSFKAGLYIYLTLLEICKLSSQCINSMRSIYFLFIDDI